jgi:hypothetical protein
MVLVLRNQSMQADLEGVTPQLWHEENYTISESTPVGRIYQLKLPPIEQWAWAILVGPEYDAITKYGLCGTFEEAKEQFTANWEALCRRMANRR